jgi:hypothetical protein
MLYNINTEWVSETRGEKYFISTATPPIRQLKAEVLTYMLKDLFKTDDLDAINDDMIESMAYCTSISRDYHVDKVYPSCWKCGKDNAVLITVGQFIAMVQHHFLQYTEYCDVKHSEFFSAYLGVNICVWMADAPARIEVFREENCRPAYFGNPQFEQTIHLIYQESTTKASVSLRREIHGPVSVEGVCTSA